MSLKMAHKVILPPKKNYIPQFLKQRDINSYYQQWFVCYFTLLVHQESGTGLTAASGYLMLTAAAVSSQEQPFS
jgi:hypothetical protein